MPSTITNNLLPEFDSVKDDDEEILWTGRPSFIPFTITAFSGLITLLIFAAFYYMMTKDLVGQFEIAGGFSHWFVAIPFIVFLWASLRKILSFTNIGYAYTSRRILIRSGFFGTDVKSIDYDKILDIEVTVNFVERLFGVGTIRFFTGRTEVDDGSVTRISDNWEAISNPYEIFKQIKRASADGRGGKSVLN